MIEYMEGKPIISSLICDLGEGTGAAVAFPILQSAVAFSKRDGLVRLSKRKS